MRKKGEGPNILTLTPRRRRTGKPKPPSQLHRYGYVKRDTPPLKGGEKSGRRRYRTKPEKEQRELWIQVQIGPGPLGIVEPRGPVTVNYQNK